MTHQIIHAEDISYGERQRKEFKEKPLEDLAESILRVGLIHAPVITASDRTLVAGERRLRALARLENRGPYKYAGTEYEYPQVPVNIVPYDDAQLLFEIELEENLRRVDLTAMEEANAIAALHALRLEDNPAQTRKETAAEITALEGKQETKSADEVRVADAILVDSFKDDPEVQKAAKQSLKRAAKVARKKMELTLLRSLQAGEESTPDSMFAVYPGDCISVMQEFEDASFDVMIFDPPYGVDADKFGEAAHDLGHQYKDDWDSAKTLVSDILAASTRIMKEDAHLLMFCPFETFNYWRQAYAHYGYRVWPRPLIWYKGQQGHAPVPDYGPRYSYECILFATRGTRKIAALINDVISVPAVRDKLHAAEKPAELLGSLIDFTCKPGDRIIDPTCGSGSIFTGARGREVYVTGIELESNSYSVARDRAK